SELTPDPAAPDVTVPRAPVPRPTAPSGAPPPPDPKQCEITHTMIVQKPTILELKKVKLAVVEGTHQGLELVSDKEWLRVGAHSSNDLVLSEDRTASRHQLEALAPEAGY